MKAIDLILKIDELSLEKFCSEAVAIHLRNGDVLDQDELQEDGRVALLAISDQNDMSESKPLYQLHKKLTELHENQLLPHLYGLVGEESLTVAHEYADYISELDGGKFKSSKYEDGRFIDVSLDGKKVHVVSTLQESEVIAASTELPGHYYIIYHDDGPAILACSHEQFIKVMIGLSLLTNVNTFEDFLDWTAKGVSFDESNFSSLNALHNVVFEMDEVLDCLISAPESISDKYWDVREAC